MKGQSILWTQGGSLAGPHRAPHVRVFQGCSKPSKKGSPRQGMQLVRAAAVADQDFNLKSILEDSLKAPVKGSEVDAPAPAVSPISPAIPEAPSQPPQLPQAQTTAPLSGAGSSIEEAIKSTSTVENTAAPAASPAASQAAESAGDAASTLLDRASEGASKLAEQGGGLPDAAASTSQAAPEAVQAAASEAATQAAASAPKFTQGSALDAYLEATKSAKKGFKAAVPEPPSGSSVQESFSSAQEAATSAISSLTEGVSTQAKAALSAASGATSGVQAAASDALQSLNQATSGAVDQAGAVFKDLSGGVSEVTSSLQESISATAGAASSAAEAASANLPEPVRDALAAAKGPVSQVVSQVASSPPLLAGAAALAVGLPTAGWIRDRLGGYSGPLQPARALEVLQSENAILLDMRSDEERECDGTAALTAGAIGRGAAVPLPYIGGSLSRNVRDADELAYQIAATVAFGLVQMQPRAKVVVMDARGSKRAVRLARTLLASGVSQAFIVQGGYRGWVNAGLPTKTSPEYAASPVAVISERLSGVTSAATGSLGRPTTVLAALAAGGVVYLSVFDTLLLLRWLGTFALLFTAFNRVVSYSSPNDFIADLQGIGRPFAWVGGRISGLVSSSDAASQPSVDAVRQPSELPDGTPMDLDVEVEQAGAAIVGKASEAGQQAIEAAAEVLDPEDKREEKQNSSAERVERNV